MPPQRGPGDLRPKRGVSACLSSNGFLASRLKEHAFHQPGVMSSANQGSNAFLECRRFKCGLPWISIKVLRDICLWARAVNVNFMRAIAQSGKRERLNKPLGSLTQLHLIASKIEVNQHAILQALNTPHVLCSHPPTADWAQGRAVAIQHQQLQALWLLAGLVTGSWASGNIPTSSAEWRWDAYVYQSMHVKAVNSIRTSRAGVNFQPKGTSQCASGAVTAVTH